MSLFLLLNPKQVGEIEPVEIGGKKALFDYRAEFGRGGLAFTSESRVSISRGRRATVTRASGPRRPTRP